MIEINLAKKKTKIQFAGVDLSKLPYIKIALAFLIQFLLPGMFKESNQKELKETNEKISEINKEIDKIKAEERRLADLKEQIDAFKAKTKQLEERSIQVEKILQIKTNPNKLLEKLARSMPEDLWVTKIQIQKNRLTVIGQSISYPSIGLLLEQLRESPFFDEKFKEGSQKTIERQLDGEKVRLIEFKINGPIVRYNPF